MSGGEREPVAVLGAGGHGKVVVSALRAMGEEVAVFDDTPEKQGRMFQGAPVVGPVTAARERGFGRAVIAIGRNEERRRVLDRVDGFEWVTVVHPAAWVHESVELGQGTVVFAGAVIQPDVVIGAYAIVNTRASIDHDCRVGDFAHVAPGVSLGGHVTVGEGALVGIGSSVIPGVRIGAWATVGAGAAVVRDVPDGETWAGVPARRMG